MSIEVNRAKIKDMHQVSVETFMRKSKQQVRDFPQIPTLGERKRQASLLLEETLETIEALGLSVVVVRDEVYSPKQHTRLTKTAEEKERGPFEFTEVGPCDLIEVADGCSDVRYVATGTFSSCGISAYAIQAAVDEANLEKFGPGHSFREDGKLIKPPGWKKPDLQDILLRQGMALNL